MAPELFDLTPYFEAGFIGIFIAFFAVFLLANTFFTVNQQTTAVVQRLGRFLREAGPGLHFKIPFVDRIVERVNLRVQQLDVKIETKTEDNVFVQMVVAVQYFVLPEKVYDAFYKLDDANRQITSFVFDVVRAQVPKIKLDDVFAKKDDIANIVKSELALVMEGFGYGIMKALVTDIDPDARVKESMNEINAAQRMRVAATEKGETSRKHLALLTDRVRVRQGKPQLYGTQFSSKQGGPLIAEPIEDEGHLDQRRLSVGLSTMAEEVRRIQQMHGKRVPPLRP